MQFYGALSCNYISSLVDVATCLTLYQTHSNNDQTAYTDA